MKRPAVLLAAALLLLIAALAGKGALVAAPDVPAQAAPGGFDTARAVARLQRILGDQRPHPVDSAADDAVRARLIGELRALGLAPRVTDHWACAAAPRSRAVSCARVRNVTATIGPATGPHLLVASHYDSTVAGPGAADDGIGVATALEIAAILKDRRLGRPVTFLFDEGEEAGLLGAVAFLQHDPLAARVDSVVNLEARGVTGPAIMFETSRPNGAAIARFARSAVRPVANSMTADIYRLIPNSTDVSVFAERPWAMLNFAIIGNETRYHSPGDTIAALDRRSVHHMGEQALAAASELAAAPVAPGGGSWMYADVLGRALVRLPIAAGLGLLATLAAAFAWIGWRRRAGLGRALGAVAAALLASALLSWLAEWLLVAVRQGEYWRGHPGVASVALDVTAVAVSAAVLGRIAGPLARDRLRAAYWLVLLAVGAAIAGAAPGAAIFFLLPPLVALGGIAIERRRPGAERVASLLAFAILFLSVAPLVHLGGVLVEFSSGWIFALLSALIVLPVLIELKPLLIRAPTAARVGTAAIPLLAAWAAVALTPAYSADRKQLFRIEYAWNAAAQRGFWLIANDGAALPPGFAGFGKDRKVAWSASRRWAAPAPSVPLTAPRIDRLAERRAGGARLLTLRLASAGAEAVTLRFAADAGVRAVRVPGSGAAFGRGKPKDPYFWRCTGRSCDGLAFDLLVAGRPTVTLIGTRSGLPSAAAPLMRKRPANAGPQYAPDQSFALDRVRL